MELVHVKTHEQKNPVHHECSKHIDTRFHFIREHIKEGDVELVNVKIMNKLLTFFKVIKDSCFLLFPEEA